MPGLRIPFFLVLLTLAPAVAQAGIYSTIEPFEGPSVEANGVEPLGFAHLQDTVRRLGLELANPKSKLSQEYQAKCEELERKAKRGQLSTEEKVNLSYYLIRLGKAEQAVALLRPAAAQERSNFMVFANLGTAYQQMGDWEQATRSLALARDLWPKEWKGFTVAQLKFLLEAERLQGKLARLRWAEAQAKVKARELDALFGDSADPIRYVDDNGKMAAGSIAEVQKAKLPANALALLQQLVTWLPQDTRLWWQLAEAYNAQGDIPAAMSILEDMVWTRRYDSPAVKERRQILQDAMAKAREREKEESRLLPHEGRLYLVVGLGAVVAVALLCFQLRELARRLKRAR